MKSLAFLIVLIVLIVLIHKKEIPIESVIISCMRYYKILIVVFLVLLINFGELRSNHFHETPQIPK